MDDQRAYRRMTCDYAARLRLLLPEGGAQAAPLAAVIIDCSTGGIRIRTAAELRLGAEVQVELNDTRVAPRPLLLGRAQVVHAGVRRQPGIPGADFYGLRMLAKEPDYERMRQNAQAQRVLRARMKSQAPPKKANWFY